METTLRMIENHGLTLIAIILLVAWLRPKIDDMWRLIMGMANPEKEPMDKRLERSNECDDKIMAILRAVQTEFRCDRAYVFQYHNGGENMLGNRFSRTSCTHEVVALGVPRQQQLLQNMPKTLVHSFTKLIDSGVGVFCPCIQSCFMETDASTYETLAQQGIVSVYCAGLYSDARFPIGFLGIDFCTQKTELTEAQFDMLKLFAERAATTFCMAGNKLCRVQEN